MVSKSYAVNDKVIAESENNAKMENSDQLNKFDRYMLHISNEMVSRARK